MAMMLQPPSTPSTRLSPRSIDTAVQVAPMDANQKKIMKKWIMKAPPCQMLDVISGCRRLVQQQIPKEVLLHACRDHNEATFAPVQLSDGYVGIICPAARVGGILSPKGVASYCDPGHEGRTFEVDHERQECVSLSLGCDMTGDSLLTEFVEPYRLAVERVIDKYAEDFYPPRGGIATGECFSIGANSSTIQLQMLLVSRFSRPKAYWSGVWNSVWNLTFTPGVDQSAVLDGYIDFSTHSSEDANMHFHRKQKIKVDIEIKADLAEFGDLVIGKIGAEEREFHEETEEICHTFGSTALKAMRRLLPMSKERFDWRPIRHALVKDMKSAATAKE